LPELQHLPALQAPPQAALVCPGLLLQLLHLLPSLLLRLDLSGLLLLLVVVAPVSQQLQQQLLHLAPLPSKHPASPLEVLQGV